MFIISSRYDKLSQLPIWPSLSTAKENITAVIPQGAPERWRLAHYDCSESASIDFHLDGHLSESTVYMGHILTTTRKK